MVELLPKYPDECSLDEKAQAESLVRAAQNAFLETRDDHKARDWSRYFWTHNYDLAVCKPHLVPIMGATAITPKQFNALRTVVVENTEAAREFIARLALKLRYDLYQPERGEILHGLFARCVRLFLLVCENLRVSVIVNTQIAR